MARQTYRRSDETFKALSGFETATANEGDYDPSYVFKIKNGDAPDPFPPFRRLFRASARARGNTEFWLNVLLADYTHSRIDGSGAACSSELLAKLVEKNQTDADALGKILEGIADGQLDESECHTILGALAKNEAVNARLKTLVQKRLGEIVEAREKRQ